MRTTILAALMAGAVPFALSPAAAAIINVPGDEATIQGAIDAAVDGDEVVIAPGTYVGPVLVNEKSITVRGSDPNDRPVLALQGHDSLPGQGFTSTGFVISGDDIEVNVSDLICIPASEDGAARAIQTTTNTTLETITVNFDNILITGNAGGNAPSVTDPWDDDTDLGTGFSSDGMYLVNRAFLGTLHHGVGKYTLNDVVVIGAGRDGIIIYVTGTADPQAANADEAFATLTGSAVSRSVRNHLQWGNGNDATGTYNITGSRENPGLILRNNATGGSPSGSGVSGINGSGATNIDHLVYVDNPSPLHIVVSTSNPQDVVVANSLFANTPDEDALTFTGTGEGTVEVRESTFFNNGDPADNFASVWIGNTELASGQITENVFGGAGTGAIIVSADAGTNLTVDHNGLPTSGPDALEETIFGAGAGEVTSFGNLNNDPEFTSTDVSSLTALQTAFDVMGSVYEFASPDVTAISGWGDFVDGTPVEDWHLY